MVYVLHGLVPIHPSAVSHGTAARTTRHNPHVIFIAMIPLIGYCCMGTCVSWVHLGPGVVEQVFLLLVMLLRLVVPIAQLHSLFYGSAQLAVSSTEAVAVVALCRCVAAGNCQLPTSIHVSAG